MRRLVPAYNERVLFHLFALANVVPVWLNTYAASLDGPQHLYIAQVINQLWSCNPVYEQFYQFSSPIIGNQTGNLILAFFQFFLPAWLAEKLLMSAYLLGIAYAFRYLVFSVSGTSSYLTFLIFPFAYHVFFLQGYYNFSLGYVFLFLALAWWNDIKNKIKARNAIIMSLLLLLTYFTHLFVFGLLLIMLGLVAIVDLIVMSKTFTQRRNVHLWIRQNLILLTLALPGIALSLLYLRLIPALVPSPVETEFLMEYLSGMKILIGFQQAAEMRFTQPLLIYILMLTAGLIIYRSFSAKRQITATTSRCLNKNDLWLIAAILLGVINFMFSYSMPAGSIATRLILTMFFILLLWLAAQPVPKWLQLLTVAVVVIFSLAIRKQQHGDLYNLDHHIKELLEMEQFIEENSIIMSVNFSDNWTHLHFKNYLGSAKPIVNIHTEAISPYFIVDWNAGQMPDLYLGTLPVYRFNHYSHPYQSEQLMIAQKVVVWGYKKFSMPEFEDLYKTALLQNYELIYVSSNTNGALFELTIEEEIHHLEQEIILLNDQQTIEKSASDKGMSVSYWIRARALEKLEMKRQNN